MAHVPEESSSSGFHHEIKCMMYSLGDARHPNTESASLIEEITQQQTKNIIVQAIRVVHLKGSHTISLEDILFLLRKDKSKLRRLMKHLQLKQLLRSAASTKSTSTPEDDHEIGVDDGLVPQAKKRKVSVNFLGPLDAGHFGLMEPDTDEEERLQKQDALTNSMDSNEYADYTECRRVSFHRKMGKFKEWLKIDSYSELKPTQDMMEVLSYLAYDTVREIVELSLQVMKDMESVYFDPSSAHNLHLPLACQSAQGSALSSTAPRNGQSGEANSDIVIGGSTSSPTSPGSPKAGTTTTTRAIHGGRKRRHQTLSTGQETSPTVGSTAQNISEDSSKQGRAIQPVHIREAMRRQSVFAGPLTPLATHFFNPTIKQRTLCL